MVLNYDPMPPRLLAFLLLAVLALNSCSPAARVARYYNRYTRGHHKELRKPQHNLPLR